MIRRTVKEIIGLPTCTNDNLFYSPKRLRGSGLVTLVRCKWEVFLQHFSIGLFQSISNYLNEMSTCIENLGVLRTQAFDTWCVVFVGKVQELCISKYIRDPTTMYAISTLFRHLSGYINQIKYQQCESLRYA